MVDHDMTNAATEDSQEVMQNKIINEEYKIWKKNSVFLYDIMYSRALDWPTLTTQWLPDVKDIPGKAFRTHRLLIGTHTSKTSSEFLMIAHINLPTPPAMTTADYNPSTEELGGHAAAKEPINFSVIQKISHDGEVNKARYQPQNPNIIATFSPSGNVYVWDRTKHSSVPDASGIPKPQATLTGHKGEGFALEWNPFVEGQLLSGGEDETVCLWEVQRDFTRDNPTISPARRFTQHSGFVNDVQYHPQHGKHLFGSVSDDLSMCLMDTRGKSDSKPAIVFKDAHTDAINTLSFHPKHDKLFATGSHDKTIGIFDLRFPNHGKIHSLEGHKDTITKVEWHPTDSGIIASASNDRRIIFWDISKAGAEQTPEDAEDGPPEMLFMHGGHTNHPSDFSWNKNDPWVMCSAGEDNLIQCWRASRHLVEQAPAGVHRREVSET
ncbi:histone acetyltransferase type B subunit 2 like protein [Zymoseptoria brevis]|uniref:Histone acetyltransferase type B subunit 2 like protein n=1 Tax=Zymoseptoria brevis TaxID=1047168 RepID=A0A0F4GQY6_9PEZI|nr:histone acetyltransferase type B subunit 2 like protein [Zymoseptoria brevis]